MCLRIPLILLVFFSLTSAQVFTELGRFGKQGREKGQFNNPQSIAVSSDNTLFVVDTDNHRIQLFDSNGEFIKSIGGFGFSNDQFDSPSDIWVNSLINIYVSDYNNRRVQRYDKDMNFISSFVNNDGQDVEYQFAEISSCLVTSQNDLFILDHDEYKVLKYKRDGSAERAFGQYGTGEGELAQPQQLELLSFDKVLVSDPESKALIIFDLFGNFIKKIEFAGFKYPAGIDVDRQGNIFIADSEAGKVFFADSKDYNVKEVKFLIDLRSPRDIVVTTVNNKKILYIIDENEIVFGTLSLLKSVNGQ